MTRSFKKALSTVLSLALLLSLAPLHRPQAAAAVSITSHTTDPGAVNPQAIVHNSGTDRQVTVLLTCTDASGAVVSVQSADDIVRQSVPKTFVFTNSYAERTATLSFRLVTDFGAGLVMPTACTDAAIPNPRMVLTNGGETRGVTAILVCKNAAGEVLFTTARDERMEQGGSRTISFANNIRGAALEFLVADSYGDGVTVASQTTAVQVVNPTAVLLNGGESRSVALTLICYAATGNVLTRTDRAEWLDHGQSKSVTFTNNHYETTARLELLIDGVVAQPSVLTAVPTEYAAAPDTSTSESGPASLPKPETGISAWAVETVAAAIAAGIVPEQLQNDYPAPTTRAEFCALAVGLYERLTGTPIAGRVQFEDTDDVAVQKMAALQVVNGVGGGLFAPNRQLTRQEAATILARLAAALGAPLPAATAVFADGGEVADWALAAVGAAQQAGIMQGVGENRFAPQESYSREQCIVTIMRLHSTVKAGG